MSHVICMSPEVIVKNSGIMLTVWNVKKKEWDYIEMPDSAWFELCWLCTQFLQQSQTQH